MKQVWAKAGASVTVVLTMLVVAAAPAGASTGVLAEARPWHYWISWVLMLSIAGIVFIALPLGYYMRVYRLKHPRR